MAKIPNRERVLAGWPTCLNGRLVIIGGPVMVCVSLELKELELPLSEAANELLPDVSQGTDGGGWFRIKVVDLLVKSVVKKALIQKRVHPHVMRHTFATTLLDNGNDLETVQTLMGHSHIRTTERYLHSTDDRKVEAIQSLQFGT